MRCCDIVSKSLNDLYFNVCINERMEISWLDLSSITSALVTPYYKDIVVNNSLMSDQLTVQIGPMNQDIGTVGAILNELEVLKMSNSVNNLDGNPALMGRKRRLRRTSTRWRLSDLPCFSEPLWGCRHAD